MSHPVPANQPAPAPTNSEEVFQLFCPNCNSGLNIRRKHIGVAGKCIQCNTAVVAQAEGGKVALIAVNPPQHQAPPQPAPTPAASAPTIPQEANPDTAAGGGFSRPSETPASPWGFPGREEESNVSRVEPAPNHAPAPPAETSSSTPTAPQMSAPPQLSPAESNAPAAHTESMPVLEPEQKTDQPSPFASPPSDAASPFGSNPISEPNPQPASEHTPPKQTLQATAPEIATATSNDSFSLEKEVPLSTEASSLFGGQSATDIPDDDGSGEINPSWGAKVPGSGHASISPFDNNDQPSGFAESLFQEKTDVPESGNAAIQAKSPFNEIADPELGGGALFASPGAGTTPAVPTNKSEPQEEVVLDGDGRPMKPMTDEEKDNFAKEMMQIGGYHARSPWLVKIVKFFITIAVLGALGYGAYIFMPEEKAEAWKQKALDWLEPGSVLLDFLPVEIVENENGEKEMKIKAVESLNEFSEDMDAYLEASKENLRGTGAEVPEREKTEKMEAPKMPKLPFDIPQGLPGGSSAGAPKQ